MSEVTWTVCVTPNAHHGGPHLGHLWYMAHCRYMYNEIKRRNEKYALGIDLKWNILFDFHSRPDSESMFIDMLDWMGMPPDQVDYLKEWETWQNVYIVLMSSFSPYFVEWDYLDRYWHQSELDPESFLCKCLYFYHNNVFWHIRGMDLRDEGSRTEGLLKGTILRQPEYWMIPLLMKGKNQEEKIGGSDGAPPEYQLSDIWDRHEATDILRLTMDILDFDTSGETVTDMIKQFYPISSTKLHTQANRKDLIIPEDWKSMLGTRNTEPIAPQASSKNPTARDLDKEATIEAVKGLA